jgi:ATP-dependent Lon protease
LVDTDGSPRPFSIIAMGGSSNGSTLEGHNYTYVGSTWGKIVDIIIEKKCMNPIIFIDELDKVSKTEHGREIIGILTHLIDKTQNTHFQDRYFTGIDLDLSKALFIFSYNDVSLIDRILLDRIHRIKFDYLNLQEKIVIVKRYILPETYKLMGLDNIIHIEDEVIEYIIEEYTNEPGVRKLKQLIFDIVGEINLEILNNDIDHDIPIHITKKMLVDKYLSHYNAYEPQKISLESEVGVINGLWANSLGNGGIIPIQVRHFVTNNFHELKLTGMQGDVMKESMNVAKTLACSLAKTSGITKEMLEEKLQGIHIHCPDGAVPKDGPSAGAAITTAIYSLLTNKKINHLFGITGEINLQGNVTKIGGLDLKIVGGIRGGVKHFLFPEENIEDYNKFMDKNKDSNMIKGIEFTSVKTIHDVLSKILV